MKFIGKIVLAALLPVIYLSVIYEWCTSPTAIILTHWVYKINFWYQVLFWAIVFLFPKSIAQVLSLLANAALQGLTFTATSGSQLLEHLWKYNAGKIAIGSLAAYLAYIIIF